MHLRKPTTFTQEMITQEIRQILGPEYNVPPNCYRKVRICIPTGPTVWIWITDTPDDNVAMRIGPNRGTYGSPVAPSGESLVFHIFPGQTIWSATLSGKADVAMLIEYVYTV